MASRLAIALAATIAALGVAGTAVAATGRIADDPLQGQEWWLHDVGADQATPPGPGIPLAIVDSGLDVTTPEFAGRPDVTLFNNQTVFGPEEWHGTVVASVAAAAANGVGIVGIYPQAALEIWDASPVSNIATFSAAVGIETAAQHCPTVISLSFGSRDPSPQIEQAIVYAQHRGCLVVASAGNDGQRGSPVSYPAAQAHVLTVAATDQNDTVADFSTAAPTNDLSAPGTNIVGAVPLARDPTGFTTDPVEGTSFSAPIVAAAAAWIWTVRPTLDWTQLFELLRSSARDVGPVGYDPETGFGILDIPAALAAPTPPRDPFEPNDDVDEVKSGALQQPAITTAANAVGADRRQPRRERGSARPLPDLGACAPGRPRDRGRRRRSGREDLGAPDGQRRRGRRRPPPRSEGPADERRQPRLGRLRRGSSRPARASGRATC